MADTDIETLVIPALGALAASPGGAMTLPDLVSHLETRHGSTDESASDASSSQSRRFRDIVTTMLTADSGPDSLAARGLVRGGTDGVIEITPAGRAFIGR